MDQLESPESWAKQSDVSDLLAYMLAFPHADLIQRRYRQYCLGARQRPTERSMSLMREVGWPFSNAQEHFPTSPPEGA